MNKVIRFHSRSHTMAAKRIKGGDRMLDAVRFFAGVFMTFVLPETILSAYSSLSVLICLVAVAITGGLIGLAMYEVPGRPLSNVSTGTIPQTPSGASHLILKKAA